MSDDTTTRRRLLGAVALTGLPGATGCLRLSQGSEASATTTSQSGSQTAPQTERETTASANTDAATETSTRTDTAPAAVELTTIETFDDLWANHITTFESEFYVGSFEGLFRVTADGRRVWQSGRVVNTDRYTPGNSTAFDADSVYWGFRANDEGSTGQVLGGTVVGCDRSDGSKRWEFSAEADGMHHNISGLASVSPDLLVAASDDSGSGSEQEPLVYGLDPADGDRLWRATGVPAGFVETVLTYDGSPYVVTLDGIYRCNPANGAVTTVAELYSGFGRSSLVGSTLYLPGDALVAFDLSAEVVQWESKPTSGTIKTRPAVGEEHVFVGTDTGFVHAVDAADGTLRWEARVRGQVESVELTPNHVWIADGAGALTAFVRADGSRAFERQAEDRWRLGAIGDVLLARSDATRLVSVERA